MHHIESVEPRRLFAGGLDPTFGTKGTAPIPDYYNDSSAVLAVNGSVYVATTRLQAGENEFQEVGVYKLDDSGRPDRTWGDNGFANVNPINPDVQSIDKLAYDRRTGSLYAIAAENRTGSDGGVDEASLIVTRITSAGRLDNTFFQNRPQYTADSGDGISPRLEVADVLTLPSGGSVLAFTRNVSTRSVQAGESTTKTSNEVVLMKLGNRGSRDLSFGRRGFVTLLAGQTLRTTSDQNTRIEYDAPTATDLQQLEDGSFRVIDTRRRGVETMAGSVGNETAATVRSRVLVDSTVVTAAGRVDPSRGRSWRLGKTDARGTTRDSVVEFRAPLAVADGPTGVFTVGSRTSAGFVYFRLKPGVRPPLTALPANGVRRLSSVFQGAGGHLFAVGPDTITRYTTALQPDRTFGTKGTVASNFTEEDVLTADAAGRVLDVYRGSVRRFA